MSYPARGMGIEIARYSGDCVDFVSYPARGMGIEMQIYCILFGAAMSYPARGMGIEMQLEIKSNVGVNVIPREGYGD